MVIKAPRVPVIQIIFSRTDIISETLELSACVFCSDISLTALVSSPTFVKSPMIRSVEFKSPITPKPIGPTSRAIALERITEIKILKTCTPPKRDVAFII